jgi:hypothetical protein
MQEHFVIQYIYIYIYIYIYVCIYIFTFYWNVNISSINNEQKSHYCSQAPNIDMYKNDILNITALKFSVTKLIIYNSKLNIKIIY